MEDKIVLEVPLFFKDIKDVIWSVAGGKSQGPYIFSMEFYKANWDIVKYDLYECINVFFAGSPSQGYMCNVHFLNSQESHPLRIE